MPSRTVEHYNNNDDDHNNKIIMMMMMMMMMTTTTTTTTIIKNNNNNNNCIFRAPFHAKHSVLSFAEQVQVQKYKTHAYKTPKKSTRPNNQV